MVDYNAANTIGTPPRDIIKIQILQRRSDLFSAIEEYDKALAQGTDTGTHYIKSRLLALFLEISAMLKRKDAQRYKDIRATLGSNVDYETLLNLTYEFNLLLDAWDLTKIDTRKNYDTKNVTLEDGEKGL